MRTDAKTPAKGDTWINVKNQKPYLILGLAVNCTNAQDGQPMVIYRPRLASDEPFVYVRCRTEFLKRFFRDINLFSE